MKKLIFVIALLFLAAPVCAETFNKDAQNLTEINRSRPLQNPQYQKADDALGRRILDRKNKVVGVLKDIIVGQNGGVNSLNVEFDRLRLSAPVSLNYNDLKIKSGGNSYILGFDDDEITGFYPDLLAKMQTAAGDEEDNLSVRGIINADVMTTDGVKIGQAQNVLFNPSGERAENLYVSLTTGVLHGAGIAIAFDDAEYTRDALGRTVVTVPAQLAQSMTDYASQH